MARRTPKRNSGPYNEEGGPGGGNSFVDLGIDATQSGHSESVIEPGNIVGASDTVNSDSDANGSAEPKRTRSDKGKPRGPRKASKAVPLGPLAHTLYITHLMLGEWPQSDLFVLTGAACSSRH